MTDLARPAAFALPSGTIFPNSINIHVSPQWVHTSHSSMPETSKSQLEATVSWPPFHFVPLRSDQRFVSVTGNTTGSYNGFFLPFQQHFRPATGIANQHEMQSPMKLEFSQMTISSFFFESRGTIPLHVKYFLEAHYCNAGVYL